MMLLARLAALILFLAIAFVTLSPIGLRPQTGAPDLERAVAYFLFGAALAVGFPRRPVQGPAVVVLVAAALEALQLVDPGRDARIEDLLVKILGGLLGLVAAYCVMAGLRRALAASGVPMR